MMTQIYRSGGACAATVSYPTNTGGTLSCNMYIRIALKNGLKHIHLLLYNNIGYIQSVTAILSEPSTYAQEVSHAHAQIP